jgi:prepilin signal peptidase PulO-like enzyme (type II secretory pathway)
VLIFPALILALSVQLINGMQISSILLSLIPALLLLFLGLAFKDVLRKEAIGFGDIKLAVALGLLCGFQLTMLGFFIASLTAILTRIILVKFKKSEWGKPIPFGFYLVFASGLAVLV